MADHKRRFQRWRASCSKHTAYLVDQVLARVVPEFEQRGFAWYGDFAGGDPQQVEAGAIPLQRRGGETWPTAQIRFAQRGHACCFVDLADLPGDCKRYAGQRFVSIPRERAGVAEGKACFFLKRRSEGVQNEFGYRWFTLRPEATLNDELGVLLAKLPQLFPLFDVGALRSYDASQPLPEIIGLQVSRMELYSGAGTPRS